MNATLQDKEKQISPKFSQISENKYKIAVFMQISSVLLYPQNVIFWQF